MQDLKKVPAAPPTIPVMHDKNTHLKKAVKYLENFFAYALILAFVNWHSRPVIFYIKYSRIYFKNKDKKEI